MTFANIPTSVLDYVRATFAAANSRVAKALTDHPSLHEPALDQALIAELTTAPPAFFAAENAAVLIESHWLGGRHMYRRWEIADIALLVTLRQAGRMMLRKVALLQTKRLYSREIAVAELEYADYVIGIGRLGDRTERLRPLSSQRAFSFSEDCVYGALHAGSSQIGYVDDYEEEHQIPVFYGFYNPVRVPLQAMYPPVVGQSASLPNELGCRVQSARHVHGVLSTLTTGQAPSLKVLRAQGATSVGPFDLSGWRLENFVADEVLRCREGALFDGTADENLQALFYGRSAPITAAISITIDIDPEAKRGD